MKILNERGRLLIILMSMLSFFSCKQKKHDGYYNVLNESTLRFTAQDTVIDYKYNVVYYYNNPEIPFNNIIIPLTAIDLNQAVFVNKDDGKLRLIGSGAIDLEKLMKVDFKTYEIISNHAAFLMERKYPIDELSNPHDYEEINEHNTHILKYKNRDAYAMDFVDLSTNNFPFRFVTKKMLKNKSIK